MKIILSFFFLILLQDTHAQQIFSDQEFTVTLGAPYEIPRGYIHLGGFGDTDTSLVQLIYKPGKNLIIQEFDSTLSIAKEARIDISSFPPGIESQKVIRLGSNYFWLFRTVDRIKNNDIVWAQQIDIYGGKLAGKLTPLVISSLILGEWEMRLSYEKTKLLIAYRLIHEYNLNKINHEKFVLCVVDQSLNVLSKKILKMPYTEEKLAIKDYLVDSKGNAYLLGKVYEYANDQYRNQLPNYHFELLKLKPAADSLDIIPLKIKLNFYQHLVLKEQDNGRLFLAGFYSTQYMPDKSDGVFIAQFNENADLTGYETNFIEFPPEVLRQFKNDRVVKETKFLMVRQSNIMENGSIKFIGEVFYSRTNNSTTLYYGSVISLFINEKGVVRWTVIPKSQKGVNNRNSMSFRYYINENEDYFFYADHINNINLKTEDQPEFYVDGRGGCLAYSKIDKKGNVSKALLFDFSKDEFVYRPAELRYIGENAMGGLASDGQSNRLILIKKR